MVVERQTLLEPSDAAQLTTALQGSGWAAAAGAVAAARGLCACPVRLHATVLLGNASLASTAAAMGVQLEQQLQPALAALSGNAVISSSMAWAAPPLPAKQLRWDAQLRAHVLPAAATAAWVQGLQQAARTSGQLSTRPTAPVLVYEPPLQYQPLLLEVSDTSTVSSMPLRDASLLLIASQAADGGVTSDPGQHADSRGAAAAILSWLLQPLESLASHLINSSSSDPGADAVELLRQALAAACTADAAVSGQRFVDAAAAGKRQPVTAAARRRAVQLVRLPRSTTPDGAVHGRQRGAQQSGQGPEPLSLAAALGAWAAAWELQQDAITGAHPTFPPEHSLAVLMPLALPLGLVLAQAVGRELGEARRRRRQRGHASPGQAPAGTAEAASAAPLKAE